MTNAKPVLVFRAQMFKPSEPFITLQAHALRSFTPIYVGRERFGEAPKAKNFALEDISGRRSLAVVWNAVTRDPSCYAKAISQTKPVLVHAHFGPDAVYALPLARRLGIPLVTTFHGFDVTIVKKVHIKSRSPYLINYVLFYNQLLRHGALFLCVSQHIRQHALAMGCPPGKTFVHYIGVDTEVILPSSSRERPKKILHVARLVEKKGTEYLIDALVPVLIKHPTAELTIVGDGPLLQSLIALTKSLGVAHRVSFLGTRSNKEVLALMQNSGIFVLPSVTAKSGDTEGLPITILEAAAAGLPIVATRHGGIPEAIEHGKTGLLVPERSSDALAKAMDYMFSDETMCLRMGTAARKLVEAGFNLRVQTAKLENMYNDVLERV